MSEATGARPPLRGEHVTVLGLGAMGSAIAAQLLAQGARVTVWNRSPGKCIPLRERGANVAATPASAIQASPIVISCLLSTAVLVDVITQQAATAIRDRTFVDTATASPSDVARLGHTLRTRGASHLDVKLMFYPGQVGSDDSLLYVSGPANLVQRHAVVLQAIAGKPTIVGGEITAASIVYNAVWTYYYCALFGFLEALAFVRSADLDTAPFVDRALMSTPDLIEHIRESARRVDSGALNGDQAAVGVYVEGFETMTRAFREHGIRSRMLESLYELSRLADAYGYGDADIASVTTAILEEQAFLGKPPFPS